jgi:hypothetical protein
MTGPVAAPVVRPIVRAGVGITVAAALLLPIWAFAQFPSQDGPSHVENAWILLGLLRGDASLRAYYEVNLEPVPNWFSHAALATLMTVARPTTAEKLLLTSYVLLLPVSFRYALASIRPQAAGSFWLVVPFVYTQQLHLGFYNRAFALIPFFLAFGYWMRRRGRLGLGQIAALGALLLWLYFCAAVSLVLAVLGIGLLAVLLGGCGTAAESPTTWPVIRDRILALTAASGPALVLVARFHLQQGAMTSGPGPGLAERLWCLASLRDLASYDPRELWLSAALGAALAAGLLVVATLRWKHRSLSVEDGLLAVALAYGVVYLAAPAMSLTGVSPGGGPTHGRVSLHVPLVLLLWLGVQPLGQWLRRSLLTCAVVIGLGLIALRLPRYRELNDHLAEYLSAGPWVPPGSTLLSLSFAHQGAGADGHPIAWRVWPFRHAASRLAVARGLVNLDNYEASAPYFPVVFRTRANPYPLLGSNLDRMPACVHIGRFNRMAPRPVDYVLVWAGRRADRDDVCAKAVFQHLREHYRLVYVSSARRQVELHRLREASGTLAQDLPAVGPIDKARTGPIGCSPWRSSPVAARSPSPSLSSPSSGLAPGRERRASTRRAGSRPAASSPTGASGTSRCPPARRSTRGASTSSRC